MRLDTTSSHIALNHSAREEAWHIVQKRLTSRKVYPNVCACVCVLLLPDRCIQRRGFLGQGLTGHWQGLHCYRNSLLNKDMYILPFYNHGKDEQTEFKTNDPKLGMWAEFDFDLTYVHILHSIVWVVCTGDCTLHSKVSWCR